jgi:hypothetical protein
LIRHIPLTLVIEGNIEGARRRGRRRKHLLYAYKETKRYWKLKDDALDDILRTPRSEKYCGPLARRYVRMIMIMIMMVVVVVVILK